MSTLFDVARDTCAVIGVIAGVVIFAGFAAGCLIALLERGPLKPGDEP
jgi:hypothetical protein